MIKNILSLSKKLISIKSTADNPKALASCLKIALTNLKGYSIEQFQKNRIKSALIYNSSDRPKKFKIILNAHLDIIPGKDFQYDPKVINDKLYGVGAMDMKASTACLIYVFNEVANKVKYPLGLQLVTDEETGGFNGTKYQIEKGVMADFVIAGETSNFNIVNQAKGILWVKISANGKSAHGAYPWRGVNAIWKIINFLTLLQKKYPVPKQERWITTVNLSRIETRNRTFNKIPDNCEVWFDIRFIPNDASRVFNDIKKLLPSGFKIKIIEKQPPLFVDKNNNYIRLLKKITENSIKQKILLYGAQGSSDARHFTQINCPGIEFGPIGGGIGSDNEWVSISSLNNYFHILKNFLLKI